MHRVLRKIRMAGMMMHGAAKGLPKCKVHLLRNNEREVEASPRRVVKSLMFLLP